ncbi:MAG TPA: helix-turn-helix transcriptional regulator [Burkholderiales bacterium]|nr:helix-turn-helix transcriptional regulator [Burkholderiales bacterium]
MAENPPSTTRLLEYAAQRLGGRAELAARLKVTESTLAAWMNGSADMTYGKALALADLIAMLSRDA